jgi:hypothetical protein
MRKRIVFLDGQDVELDVISPSNLSSVQNVITIKDSASNELFKVEYVNDGSEYAFYVNGVRVLIEKK